MDRTEHRRHTRRERLRRHSGHSNFYNVEYDAVIGSFEQMVLLAVVRLGDRAYGMAIREEIAERTGRQASLGAVYATLDRLTAKGFLKVGSGPGGAIRGGRPRRFFTMRAPGRRALEASLESLQRMLSGVPLGDLRRKLG